MKNRKQELVESLSNEWKKKKLVWEDEKRLRKIKGPRNYEKIEGIQNEINEIKEDERRSIKLQKKNRRGKRNSL